MLLTKDKIKIAYEHFSNGSKSVVIIFDFRGHGDRDWVIKGGRQ